MVADLNGAMIAETPDLPELFSDHVHPNDRGYSVLADAFFRAITSPVGTAAAQDLDSPEAAGAAGRAASSGKLHRPR